MCSCEIVFYLETTSVILFEHPPAVANPKPRLQWGEGAILLPQGQSSQEATINEGTHVVFEKVNEQLISPPREIGKTIVITPSGSHGNNNSELSAKVLHEEHVVAMETSVNEKLPNKDANAMEMVTNGHTVSIEMPLIQDISNNVKEAWIEPCPSPTVINNDNIDGDACNDDVIIRSSSSEVFQLVQVSGFCQ